MPAKIVALCLHSSDAHRHCRLPGKSSSGAIPLNIN
jgi:hypothetical protein